MSNGEIHTISETLETSVHSSAVFSVTKYSAPPQNPAAASQHSSRQESANSFFGAMNQIHTYASTKRHTKISTGVIPLPISTFVETNVVPQIATVASATR